MLPQFPGSIGWVVSLLLPFFAIDGHIYSPDSLQEFLWTGDELNHPSNGQHAVGFNMGTLMFYLRVSVPKWKCPSVPVSHGVDLEHWSESKFGTQPKCMVNTQESPRVRLEVSENSGYPHIIQVTRLWLSIEIVLETHERSRKVGSPVT